MTDLSILLDPRLIEKAGAADIVALAKLLGAQLKAVRAPKWKWAGPCPNCGGEDRFGLNTVKNTFNCRGGGGDTIAMVRHVRGLDFVEAVEFITGEKQVAAPTRAASGKTAKSPVSDKPDGRPLWLWRQRQPILEGRPPWVYLRQARGYLGPVPATLGYLPPRDGYPPSMIAAYGLASEPEPGVLAIADADVRAVHVTRLAPDGTAKAGGEHDKITIGSPLGFPIVLAPSNDGLGLAITEGIEDGLSVYLATGLGVWAAGSAAYMPALADIVPAWTNCITVVGDQDKDGVYYATELASKLKARGFDTRLTFLKGGGVIVKEDANSIHVKHGADELRSRFDVEVQAQDDPVANGASAPSTEKRSNSGKRPLRFTLFADIDPAPRKVFLIEGLLGAGETSSFVGIPGSGKSVLAGDLACHVAGDVSWLDRRVSKGAVLYVAAERVKLTERRFAAFRKYHQIKALPLALISGAVNLLSSQEHVVEIAGYAANLKEKTKLPIVLIVIDTVSRVLCGGDENSPKDMGAFVANVAQLQDITGAHVLLIHHVPQDGNVRLRGHGALLGSLDTVVAIEKSGAIRTATVQKDNDGVEDRQIAFDLKSISLSIDPDTQEETTAPVVIPVEGVAGRSAAKSAKLPKAATIALRALQTAIAECGVVPPASNHVPPDIKTVTIDQWRDYAYRTGISTSDKANAKRTALSRASDVLVEARKIGIWEPHVWAV